MLNKADPRQKVTSWKRTIARYLSPDDPMVPSEETAYLMAKLLHVPKRTFVRPQRRALLAERVRLLEAENARLLRKIARLEARQRGG